MNTYQLITIEDEPVALSGSISGSATPSAEMYITFLVIMLSAMIITAIVIYLLKCNQYRKRYYEIITGNCSPVPERKRIGWNLAHLKELVHRTESQYASHSIV